MVGKETTIYNSLDFHMQNLPHCNVNYVQQSNASLLKSSHSTDNHMNQTKQILCTSIMMQNLSDRANGSKWQNLLLFSGQTSAPWDLFYLF